MKPLGIIITAIFLLVGGALAADAYELVSVSPVTVDVPFGFFRINVATGQVVTAWGGAQKYTIIADATPLPAGLYHLKAFRNSRSKR